MRRTSQETLPFVDPRPRTAAPPKARLFAEQNEASAAIVLRDPVKYGGEDAAIVIWARMVSRQ